MGLGVRKPVFRVSEKIIPKSACAQLQILAQKIEILFVASLDIILSNTQIKKVLISLLCACAGWSAPLLFTNPEGRFSRVEAQIVSFPNKKFPKIFIHFVRQ